MTERKVITSERAPAPKGPYSHAIVHKGILYVSGQGPTDPETGSAVKGDIEKVTARVLENIKTILEDAGSSLANVLKVTCYLKNIEDFPRFNQVYATYFSKDPPARTTIQAARLPGDIDLEIDVIAGIADA